ncbi:ribonuclease H-like domain-containing protein [Tanacetum coccineum]
MPRPSDANIVRSLWLFRHKYNADGTLNRYKDRLVANGSTQLTGIDVDETFSLVVKPATIRTVLSLALSRHWPVHQLDVKNAFLHGSLSETVYMQQPPGFRDSQHPDHVCLLQRSLYGLKQAHRAWRGSDTAYLLLYVDDIILTASSTDFLQSIIATLHAEFSMTDLAGMSPTCMNLRSLIFSALKRIFAVYSCTMPIDYSFVRPPHLLLQQIYFRGLQESSYPYLAPDA